jgi:hypothetical protein
LEEPLGQAFGAENSDTFVNKLWAPFVEEVLKLAPVAVFLMLASRGRRQPSITDGLLLGFMVGAGVSFHEDAHVSKLFVSGEGWGEATPWTLLLPTITPIANIFSLNHAVWGALSGLGLGAAVMYRHRAWTRTIAALGLLLAMTNHMMVNHFAGDEQGALELLGRSDPNWFFELIKDLSGGGRVPMTALVAGAIAAAVLETRMLRSVERRDRLFPGISWAEISARLKRVNTRAGLDQTVATERYLRLRRTVYFAGWRAAANGRQPEVTAGDVGALSALWREAGLAPPVPEAQA